MADTVAKLAQRIVDHVGTAPAITPALTATAPAVDADELEPSADSAIIATMGQLLEDDLDRVRGGAF